MQKEGIRAGRRRIDSISERKGKEGMGKTKITITIEQAGKTAVETTAGEETPENRKAAITDFSEIGEMTEKEADRYAVASDLANVCEYLEDSEVIKIRLIVSKAQARKEREENGG